MATKRPKLEEIVVKFWQVEVLMGQGMPRIGVIRQISLTEQTYYRWKEKYGGMSTEQLKELKRLQRASAAISIGPYAGQANPKRGCNRKLLSSSCRRSCIDLMRSQMKVSERRVCRVRGQHRSNILHLHSFRYTAAYNHFARVS
jgi:putative transposase